MICNTEQTLNFLLLKPICTFKGTPENVVLEHNEDVTKKILMEMAIVLKETAEDIWLMAIFFRYILKEFSIF